MLGWQYTANLKNPRVRKTKLLKDANALSNRQDLFEGLDFWYILFSQKQSLIFANNY